MRSNFLFKIYTKCESFFLKVDEAQLSRAPCEKVVKHCFAVLDRNAKQVKSILAKPRVWEKSIPTYAHLQVLESDEFEDISLELMKTIIRRDTLALNSELVVWHADAR